MAEKMFSVGTTTSNMQTLDLDPSAMQWGLQDISSSDAGRTLAAGNPMHKMRTAQKRKLALTWTMPTEEQAAQILNAFNPEYVYVRYWDPMEMKMSIRQFYVGDRSAPMKWFKLEDGTRMMTISFDIIEV